MIKTSTVILVLIFTLNARATVYFTAYDEASETIALVYSSSGGNFWQTKVKNKGLVGEQSYGLCKNATPKALLEQGLSSVLLTDALVQQCDRVNHHSYRLSAITIDGSMSSHIAKSGCHNGNIHCGNVEDTHFTITGGGLEEGVLQGAYDYYNALDSKMQFHCKLFKTLEHIYRLGGEKKDFLGASITMDNKQWKKMIDWKYRRSYREKESVLLEQLKKQMIKDGMPCP